MLKKFFVVCVFLLFFSEIHSQSIESGVLDLRGVDLYEEEVQLDGNWEFYWRQLIPPNDSLFPDQKDYFYFPATWNGSETARGVALDNMGFGTYRLRIVTPEEYPALALYLKHVYCAYTLYVNGLKLSAGGTVGMTEDTSYPGWVPKVINLPKEDTLDLVLQISNFHHQRGGARESIVLANEQSQDAHKNMILGFDLLLCGTLIMAGLFFYALFFFGQRERTALFFSLFCLTFAYRIVGADDYSLQMLYPSMSWLLTIKKEYLSLFLPPLFYALYTHALFPLTYKYPLNPFYLFAGISGLCALITIVFPPRVFTILVEPYLIVLLLGIFLAGYVYYRAHQRRMPGSKYAVISSGVALVIFAYKIIIYIGGYREIEFISFFGYLAFFFFQSLILFFIFTDSLKRSKEEAEQASRSKSDFLSMMSHEIRTPMNAVIGLSNYLLDEDPKKEQVETLNTLKFSAQNLLVIINDILDFSKIEAEKIEFVNEPLEVRMLLDSIKKIFLPIAKEKELELSITCDPQIPRFIIGDQTRTSQILTNLISNAIKFTEKGRVEVVLKLEEEAEDDVAIFFSISDTGIGVPANKQQDIFKSFTQASTSTTRQFGGTGLGLAITRKLLELQGSSIHLESAVDEGSVFYFTQRFRKLKEEQAATEAVGSVEQKLKKIEIDILLVEDNEINIMVTLKFLHKWGAKVTVAHNGEEALEIVGTRHFDLVLMDLQMPVMDGYEAVRQMRKRGVKLPIIALTASALLEEQKKIYDAGMNDYITKPFDPRILQTKILHFTQ